ncbi:glycosyltransferase [Pedobacter duraquae]|uniref:Glycosyltransferase involved in cell wall biosynthesis n=1 Tax=Pedobacter duraquae TaxID=425511 RepID=A0A4V3C3G5_9SPHI|nr:glycosyltransferase [Pedobacter duraquae]TDO21978.1 glycosyltransferase involved in cell wall biosynthesis [Pedobacter duraquae]
MKKKIVVISGANLFGGGTLSILKDCLHYANENLCNEYEVYALIHNAKDFVGYANIKFLEFREVRKSYFNRLYYEYWYYKRLSTELQPYLWLSMNDMSSNVYAERRAVYCHNPTPFKKLVLSDIWNQTQVFFFTLFYKFLYRINIRKNNYVIVQQNWLRIAFSKMFKLDLQKIIVSPPKVISKIELSEANKVGRITKTFFFPTYPRPFKNIAVIGEAVKILNAEGFNDFSVLITVDGSENQYAATIVKNYDHLAQMKFLGLISREEVFNLYQDVDYLIFPSTLETWGLPITEFKLFNKPILLSDLEYAHETLGDYHAAAFFDPENPKSLVYLMSEILKGKYEFESHKSIPIKGPLANNWKELFTILLE